MKISTRGRYALRMMIDIALHSEDGAVKLRDISARQGISVKYLEQIVQSLVKPGLLRSSRGAGGGYRLTKAPGDYTAGEILRVIEGQLAPVACLEDDENRCPRRDDCPTLPFWQGLDRVVNDYVDGVTLLDLMHMPV